MKPAYFLDTNILIYATSLASDHTLKKPVARQWVARTDWGISSQVLMEFYANASQARHGLPPTAPLRYLERIAARRPVQSVDKELVLAALNLRHRYRLSHWDAAILCAAQRLGAHTVVSEDLGNGQVYEGITVINPFLSSD